LEGERSGRDGERGNKKKEEMPITYDRK